MTIFGYGKLDGQRRMGIFYMLYNTLYRANEIYLAL